FVEPLRPLKMLAREALDWLKNEVVPPLSLLISEARTAWLAALLLKNVVVPKLVLLMTAMAAELSRKLKFPLPLMANSAPLAVAPLKKAIPVRAPVTKNSGGEFVLLAMPPPAPVPLTTKACPPVIAKV